MRKAWAKLGRLAFFVSIPLLHVYLRSHKRTRVLIVSHGKVLLVKGWLGSGKWILPGGGRHRGESAIDAAVRELHEETGIDLPKDKLKDAGEAKFAGYGLRYTYQQFIAELPRAIKLKKRRIEIIDAAWLSIDVVDDRVADADVIRLLAVWKGLKHSHPRAK